jgi:small-conductance mechanosensitive channel
MMANLFWPAVAFVLTSLAALGFRAALLAGIRRWTGNNADSAFLQAIRVPSALWCLVLGLVAGIQVAEELTISRRLAERLGTVLEAAIILSVTITLAGVLASVVAAASERRSMGGGVTGLARTSVRLIVLVIGLLVMLSSLGIQITPILTALGVGGLAVALAVQDTLSNLFAGMHLLADKPIRVGDYVRLGDGIEGYVVDLSWRSTRLRTLQNNTIVVPNQQVARSVITNYDLPEPRMLLPLRVSVAYGSDPDRVERVLLDEVTRAMADIPGLLDDPKPTVRLIPGFGDSSLDYTLACHVASFVDQFEVQHLVRTRLLQRLAVEGIEIPYPTRTVLVRDAGARPGTPA